MWEGCDGMDRIQSIACGESHTLVLLLRTRQGGGICNDEGAGEGGRATDSNEKEEEEGRGVAGEEGGDVLVCGRNHRGQLGIGAPSLDQLVLSPAVDKCLDEVGLDLATQTCKMSF